MPITIHLIGNAHLDPVWLWDWREGLNEGLSTCRTMVDLLAQVPELKFIRGEAVIYEHIERHDPPLFAAIRRLIRAGRWDVVGGNYIQPDTNLPTTEALVRQFVRGKDYFRRTFGLEVTAAWAADSFGHAAGLPEIFAAVGLDSFAFTRPPHHVRPIAKQAFWWRAASGARILSFRPRDDWYGTERATVLPSLDTCLKNAVADKLDNVAFFYGLGNHGGGPTLMHLRDIAEWTRAHPEVRVQHSGLHPFFAALRTELRRKGAAFIPTVEGELNFCLRGCSASVAKFKFAYRRAEAQMLRAERTSAAIAAATKIPAGPLATAWDTLLFNSFHDILPGSSIERAFDDQIAQVGGAIDAALRVESNSLLDLARQIDTRPPAWPIAPNAPQPMPVLLWNPHPRELATHVEMEVPLDYRPLWDYHHREAEVPLAVAGPDGRAFVPQRIANENDTTMGELPWRFRVVVPVKLPPFGWQVWQMGLDSKGVAKARVKSASRSDAQAPSATEITNGLLQVAASPGEVGVKFLRRGREWLKDGLQVRLYNDPWGSWGGMSEEKESWLLTEERERWKISRVEVLESGPERAALAVRFEGRRSRLDFTFLIARGENHIQVRARAFLDERSARLKLVIPGGGTAEYSVPGGVARREPCGEVPGGRWLRIGQASSALGFASDALYGFETTAEEFRATVARASRYASDSLHGPDDKPWMPAVDCGELRFRFLLTPDLARLPDLADELEESVVALPVPPRAGKLAATGSLAGALPPGFRLLALLPKGKDQFELRLQNTTAQSRKVSLTWLNQNLSLGLIPAGAITSWSLIRQKTKWIARRLPRI